MVIPWSLEGWAPEPVGPCHAGLDHWARWTHGLEAWVHGPERCRCLQRLSNPGSGNGLALAKQESYSFTTASGMLQLEHLNCSLVAGTMVSPIERSQESLPEKNSPQNIETGRLAQVNGTHIPSCTNAA